MIYFLLLRFSISVISTNSLDAFLTHFKSLKFRNYNYEVILNFLSDQHMTIFQIKRELLQNEINLFSRNDKSLQKNKKEFLWDLMSRYCKCRTALIFTNVRRAQLLILLFILIDNSCAQNFFCLFSSFYTDNTKLHL